MDRKRPRPDRAGTGAPPTVEERSLVLLGRRPLTESELRARLLDEGYGEREVDGAVRRRRRDRSLDDRRLAEHFILVRTARLHHGPARLMAELAARGVEEKVARSAWEALAEQGAVDSRLSLSDEVLRRIARAGGRLDERGFAKVYTALLRAGFEVEAVEAALAPYRTGLPHPDEDRIEGNDDDIA